MECIFCKIVNKEIPAKLIYENEHCIAFDDKFAQAPIHKLIIPRQHIATLNDADDALMLGNLLLAAKDIAKQLNVAEDGYRIVTNCNAGAGQSVFHIHIHLLAGRYLSWPPG